MRDVLQIAWGMDDQPEAFHKLLPSNGPITVNFDVFQQFVLSRQQVCMCMYVHINIYMTKILILFWLQYYLFCYILAYQE